MTNNDARAKAERLRKNLAPLLESLPDGDHLDLVVGIPFSDEDTTVAGVVSVAQKGLEEAGLADRSCVVVLGPRESRTRLSRSIQECCAEHTVPVLAGAHSFGLEGQGWAIRGLLEVASSRSAALVILPAGLLPREDGPGTGFSTDWLHWMSASVLDGSCGLALARFSLHPFEHVVESLFAYPVVTAAFGVRLRQPNPGVVALANGFVHTCASVESTWPDDAGPFGWGPFIVARALLAGVSIAEVPVGLASSINAERRLKLVFRQVAHALFRQIAQTGELVMNRPATIDRPLRAPGFDGEVASPAAPLDSPQLFRRFKREFDHFEQTLFAELLPGEMHDALRDVADEHAGGHLLSADDWVEVVNRFLTAFRFEPRFDPDDIVDGLFPLFLARLGAFIQETMTVDALLKRRVPARREQRARLIRLQGNDAIERQADRFAAAREGLRRTWKERETERAPYLPQIGSWEFVPGVGVSVPQVLRGPDEKEVFAREIYVAQIERYRERFMEFVTGELGLPVNSRSSEILSGVHDFMVEIDRSLDARFDHDLTRPEGAQAMLEDSLESFGRRPWFQLSPDAARQILVMAPPQNLITRLRRRGVGELLGRYGPNDALAMASWSEPGSYLEHVLHVLEDEADPSWFVTEPVRPMALNTSLLTDPTEMHGLTSLSRLAGRLVMSNLHKGWGGDYPTLWFLLRMLQNIVGGEMISEIREEYAKEKDRFIERLVNSIRGHWGRHVQSAHNFFMNRQQRNLAERLERFAAELAANGDAPTAAKGLESAVEVYDLSVTLPDAAFVPLSAWTWTSYSFRGGLGSPTPLSSLVERDWATVDFITELAARAGIADEATIYRTVVRLIGEGREHADLGLELFGDTRADVADVQQAPAARRVPATRMTRPVGGPILEPIANHDWESRYVLNAAAFRLDGNVYILYRAFGSEQISRIGMAWSKNGIDIDGRLDHPVFAPETPEESHGTEDPRVVRIGDRLYMLYTAYDGKLPQIAMASISCDAFLERRFDQWYRHGLAYPGLANKDAILYPETFDGRYAVYHRIDPNMWLSYLDDLECPWPRHGHKIILRPRSGMMWDAIKIGAGAQPIKTTHGWLNIYHGVDYERCYRLGVLFMPLDDPGRVIYQSPNAVLEPELDFEVGGGEGGDFWVPRVVFTCGAVPAEDKDVIGPDDDVLVYYGAADTAIGVARGRLRDLVPIIDNIGADTTAR